jgi:pimeloyl-ACP methyl ester carboxylesterase
MGREETITTPDGRRLAVTIWGPEDGDPVIAHGGTPDDGRLRPQTVEAGVQRGLRQVSYARPGYADSDRNEGRSVADCAADVEAIADALGIERFHTMGWSGGGPHVLATAALLPERVMSAATVAGAAPHDADDLDWGEGMGDENIEEIGLAAQGAEALAPWLERQADELRNGTPEDLLRVLGDLVSDVDRATLTGEYAEHSLASFQKAVSHGVWGWLDDDLALVRSWGFDLDSIRVPVTIWHGAQDRFVPLAHGQWLAENVPGARARLLEDEGHLSLGVGHHGDVLDDLLAAPMAGHARDGDTAA